MAALATLLRGLARPHTTGNERSILALVAPRPRVCCFEDNGSLVYQSSRSLCTSNVDDEVQVVNDLFAEAREELENAKEDAETVYFNESAETAKLAVDKTLQRYYSLVNAATDEERGKLQRSMGLKMEQLKAELEQLDHLHMD